MNSSIISGNTAYSESSGGIYNVGTMTLYNSTISENIGGNGGGIRNDGNMILYNSTVSGNTSQVGGGIYTQGSVTLQNSILAGNTSLGTGPDCYGSISSAGYNLIGNTTGCTINGDATGNITGVDPLLGPYKTMVVQRLPTLFCSAARPSMPATRLAAPISKVILSLPTNEANPASVAVTWVLTNCSL